MKSTKFQDRDNDIKSIEQYPEYYFARMDLEVFKNINQEQKIAIRSALENAIPKPSPKNVDLRIPIELIIARFYLVLFVGRDWRKDKHLYKSIGITKFAYTIAASLLLIGLNLSLSLFLLISIYLIKALFSINLFPGHLQRIFPS